MKNIGLFTKAAGAALVLAAGLMVGCGSDGGSSVKKGTFEDAAVIGISFKTATQEGTTDENGTFKYKKGESVTFFIGGLELPPGVPQDGIITPAHLAGTADWEEDAVALSIIRFLMTLDSDNDPENGIEIDTELAAEIEEWLEDQEEDFNFNLGYWDDMIGAAFDDAGVEYVSEEDAILHFTATIEDLGIDIEIQIVSTAVACTVGNTGAIQGLYTSQLVGAIEDNILVEVDGTSLTIDDDDESIDSCTFVQTQATVADITIITSTWVWTKNSGQQTYTINLTDGVKTIVGVDGTDTGTGPLNPAVSQ